MADVMTEMLLTVVGGDTEAERARLTDELREDLLELDVRDVRRPEGSPPQRAKGDALEWAQLAVSMIGALPPLIAVVQSWLRRNPGSTVTVSIDGDELTMSDTSTAERREIADAWLRRHGS
jgi:Effector Associated Constant Component 1